MQTVRTGSLRLKHFSLQWRRRGFWKNWQKVERSVEERGGGRERKVISTLFVTARPHLLT